MKLTQPAFWPKNSRKPFYWVVLWLLSGLYYFCADMHRVVTKKRPLALQSICIGNATAGGAGKTPTLTALSKLLGEDKIVVVTRGFGGTIKEPALVTGAHTHKDIGDEAILLHGHAPVVVARDRVAGVKLAHEFFPDRIALLDDGLQNPSFRADLNVLVWDGFGAGNNCMLPAGPLRFPLPRTLAMTDMVVCIGDDAKPPKTPAFGAHGMIEAPLAPQKVNAFAGIGRPKKFEKSLLKAGFEVVEFLSFPDHHPYSDPDLNTLLNKNLPVLTTEKDYVRLPDTLKNQTMPVPYTVHFSHPQSVRSWLLEHLK